MSREEILQPMRYMPKNEDFETREAQAVTSSGVSMQTIDASQYRLYYGPSRVGRSFDNFSSCGSVYQDDTFYSN
jgi:hypothetical protein